MKQSTLGAILAGNIILEPVLSFLNYKLRFYYNFYNFDKILIILFSLSAMIIGLYLVFSKPVNDRENLKLGLSNLKIRQIMGVEIALVSVWYAVSFNNFGMSFILWYLSCFIIGAVLLTMKNQDLALFRNIR
jgi:hypothetical protein